LENKAQTSEQVMFVDTNNLQYELIMNAFFFENKILKPNAALLISNKKEIKEDAKMFLAKPKIYLKCGYHYHILFWKNTDSLLGDRLVNEECDIVEKTFGYKPEEACKKLSHYIEQLETKPTHYIYSLEIPVTMSPSEIREKLKDTGLNLFLIDGEKARFPDVRFSYLCYNDGDNYTEKIKKEKVEIAKKKIHELINNIKSISSVVYESKIEFDYTSYNKSTYRRGSVNITFEVGTNLSRVVSLLEQGSAKIEKQNNPNTYLVQIVATSADIQYIEDKLKQYEFIKGITEYTHERRH
jgi:hypothetical protein